MSAAWLCRRSALTFAIAVLASFARAAPVLAVQAAQKTNGHVHLRVPTTTALHQNTSVWCSSAADASQQVEQVRQVERELKSGRSQRRPARRRSSPQSAVKFFLFGCVAVHMSTMLYHSILSLE